MHKPESVQESKINKSIRDFNIQTEPLISARRL